MSRRRCVRGGGEKDWEKTVVTVHVTRTSLLRLRHAGVRSTDDAPATAHAAPVSLDGRVV